MKTSLKLIISIITVLIFASCTRVITYPQAIREQNIKDSIANDKEIKKSYKKIKDISFPSTATNKKAVGNDWYTFDWEGNHYLLYKGFRNYCITQVKN